MPLGDLAAALPGLILVAILPGMAVATLAVPRWRWWERLAAAPGLGAGLVGVIGLADHDLHAGFRLATVLPIEGLVCLGAAWRWRCVRHEPEAHRGGAGGVGLAVAVAVAAGVVASGVLAGAFRDQPLPIETDSAVHGAIAERIATEHDLLPTVPEPSVHGAWVRPRTAFEAVAALASEVGGPRPAGTMLPEVALAVALLPLGIAALALEASGSGAIAALAAAGSLMLPFPAFATTFGEMPLIVDSTLVVPLLLALRRGVVNGGAGPPLMATATVTSIWVVHGTEALTAALVGAPLILATLLTRLGAVTLRRMVVLAAACLAGAVAVVILTRVPVVPSASADAHAGVSIPESTNFADLVGHRRAIDAWFLVQSFMPGAALALVLALVGGLAAFHLRRMRWVVVGELLVLGCFADSVVIGALHRVWVAVYPWANDDRLLSIQLFTLPLLMALAVTAVWEESRHRLPGGRRLGALPLALAGAAFAAIGLHHASATYTDAIAAKGVVGDADLRVMALGAASLPPGSAVLTDGGDAGLWIDTLTPETLFESRAAIKSHGPGDRVVELANACSRPPDRTNFDGVDAVFVGSRTYTGWQPAWKVECLERVPWLRRVVDARLGGDEAALFAVAGGRADR